jgi:hypothetical protein
MKSFRDVSLATLLCFSSGCIFQCGTYTTTPPQHRPAQTANNRPKPAARPPARPNRPKPSAHTPKPRPKPQPRPEPKPQPRPRDPSDNPKTTQIVVPVRVDFAQAVEQVDAMIQKTITQDWQTVSASGATIKVDVRYTVWRDPLKASFDNGTLKVDARVHYAADVRASAKIAGKRVWLTKGISWGTKADPQTLSAKFHAKFTIQDDYSVKADAALADIDHGPAPSGKVCAGRLVKICMTKEQAAPMVHKNLERQLVPRIQKALQDADKQFERSLRLKKQAETLWAALQQPQQLQKPGQVDCPSEVGALCTKSAWLVARPTSVGVSQPRKDGKDLRVDIGIGGRLDVKLGDKPQADPTPLPKLRTATDPPGFAVHAHVRVPLDALGEEINRYLKGKNIGGQVPIVVTNVAVSESFTPRFPRRVRLVVSVRGGLTADLEVQGELVWDSKRGELSLKDLDFTFASDNPALKLSPADQSALRRQLAAKARWKIGTKTAALGRAITRALGNVWRGHLLVNGQLSRVELEHFSMEKGALAADIVLAGQLGVSFTP